MHCPRCGTELTTISIDGGSTAVYCDQCGFANIETSPTSVEPESETWDDAFKRFHDATADTDAEDVQKKQNASTRPDDNSSIDTNSHAGSDSGSDQPSKNASANDDDDGDGR